MIELVAEADRRGITVLPARNVTMTRTSEWPDVFQAEATR
jgi:hypothetical protein